MKTFYAVTAGDYSDYRIIAITDNKERAENIKKLYSGKYSEPMLEEFFDSESKDEGLYYITYRADGSYDAFLQDFDVTNLSDINIINENTFYDDGWKYSVFVMAKDKSHAIKIAQDLWAEHKAKKEGIV